MAWPSDCLSPLGTCDAVLWAGGCDLLKVFGGDLVGLELICGERKG